MNAFSTGLIRSIRARHALVSSTGETFRARSKSLAADNESAVTSSGVRFETVPVWREPVPAADAYAPIVVFRNSRLVGCMRKIARIVIPCRFPCGRKCVLDAREHSYTLD